MDTLKSLACGHCFNISKMEIIDNMEDFITSYDDYTESYVEEYAGTFYQLTKCPACNQVNIFVSIGMILWMKIILPTN